jgi:FKBP-type peptidyl-prolyl cis-trans isomerase
MSKFSALLISVLLLTACNSMKTENVTELQIEDLTVGTGEEATSGDTVEVNYTGMLTDGTVFDASEKHGKTFSFTVGAGNVIEGWDEGVPGMKVGGTRKLTIPSDMAYGDSGIPGVIPGGATLVFEVELVSIQ